MKGLLLKDWYMLIKCGTGSMIVCLLFFAIYICVRDVCSHDAACRCGAIAQRNFVWCGYACQFKLAVWRSSGTDPSGDNVADCVQFWQRKGQDRICCGTSCCVRGSSAFKYGNGELYDVSKYNNSLLRSFSDSIADICSVVAAVNKML